MPNSFILLRRAGWLISSRRTAWDRFPLVFFRARRINSSSMIRLPFLIESSSPQISFFQGALSPRTSEGRESDSIFSPRVRIMDRSMAFSSSRTFPGHGYSSRRARELSLTPWMFRRCCWLYFWMKWSTKRGRSSFRSLRGGRWRGSTLRR